MTIIFTGQYRISVFVRKRHHVFRCFIIAATPNKFLPSLSSVSANTSNVSLRFERRMQFLWVARVGYSSGVRVSVSYSTYSVSHLFSIIPPRGSVRVQE